MGVDAQAAAPMSSGNWCFAEEKVGVLVFLNLRKLSILI